MTLGQWIFLCFVVVCVALGVAYRAKLAAFAEWCQGHYKEIRTELRKVTWPSRAEMIGNTMIVLVIVIVLSVFIGLGDMVLARIVDIVLVGK